MRWEIRIAGTGGMGVVLAGVVLGHAAVVHGGLDAVQTQSYGSEARGTAAKSEVIVSDDKIRYPKVVHADYSILMSQKSFDMYLGGAKKGSTIIIDPDLVTFGGDESTYELAKVSAMKTADELGTRMVSNMVMLGALVQRANLFSLEALENAVKDMVPEKTFDVNKRAIRAGAKQV
ncbi:2-oxoacid:ferredoxin oxidoreductase subunit gamma [Candidatus Thorarchaeota archaeon]|jgi:2-oxoglutarate ferredoxin oxidoreductase subunit gamma|nr:MAG: 2-oxoacid:ferredoxin oxidoreductase subunit gamma [Candidatus Thorarchaeota archaeon]